MQMRAITMLAAGLFAVLLCLLAPGPASAHASLVMSEPADGALLPESPRQVMLRFNEDVAPAVIRLIDAAGVERDVKFEARNETITLVMPENLPPGTQTVSYRIVSADGHPVSGSILFSIGHATGALRPKVGLGNTLAALVWLTLLGTYLGVTFGVGGVFFQTWVAKVDVPDTTTRLALAIGAVCVLASLGLQGLDALGLSLSAFFSILPWKEAVTTSLGPSVAWSLLAIACAALARRPASSRRPKMLAALALVSAGLSFAATGHAASAAPQWITRPAVMVHGLAAIYWIGALPSLFTLVRANGATMSSVLRRFSRLAVISVLAILLAGITLAVIQVREPAELFRTDYGKILLAKLAFVLLLIALASLNRLRLTPAVDSHRPGSAAALSRSIGTEIVLMLCILGLVAGWRFTPPPRATLSAASPPVHVHIHAEKAMADLTLRPGRVGSNALRIDLLDGNFALLKPIEVTISLSQPNAGIEPIDRKARRNADGSWVIDDLAIPIAGTWSITVHVLITDFEQVNLSDQLTLK